MCQQYEHFNGFTVFIKRKTMFVQMLPLKSFSVNLKYELMPFSEMTPYAASTVGILFPPSNKKLSEIKSLKESQMDSFQLHVGNSVILPEPIG